MPLQKGHKINLGRKRLPFSKEWRDKLSQSHKTISDITWAMRKWFKPRPLRNTSYFPKNNKPWNKNPNWNNGSSFEPYGLDFNNNLKEQIRKRDNYRCQECLRHQDELFKKVKGGKIRKYKLHIHHIDFNKQNNNQNNLISLCNSCHTQTLYNRENWIEYYQKKMESEI